MSTRRTKSKIGAVVKEHTSWLSPPLDYSFKQLSSYYDILKHKPRKNRTGRLPETGPNNKFVTTAVWLSNNSIHTTREASAILNHVMEDPGQLAWLDLSFNQIYDIDDLLLEYSGLKILYLHGNQLQNVTSLAVLRSLPHLRTLTLHGNPVDSIPQYRRHVIAMLPQLANLDFSPVVESERREVAPPGYQDLHKPDKKKLQTPMQPQ